MRDTASTWVLLAAIACAPTQPPEEKLAEAATHVPAPEPNPPRDMPLTVTQPPREPEPPPSFEPAPIPYQTSKTVVSHGRRACSISAILDPDVLVVYSMIDVYALIAPDLDLRPSLPARAEDPPCTDGMCVPDSPNAVLIDDDDGGPIDGRAFGFVIPIANGFWVVPLGQAYREYHCMPDVETESVDGGHARVTIRHMKAHEKSCDEVDLDEACGIACFYAGATQYDLFYEAKSDRALLVTRDYDELDDSDEPTPKVEVGLVSEAVRISGCKVDHAIPWPPQ